jgi:S1-C subfamily serine protease
MDAWAAYCNDWKGEIVKLDSVTMKLGMRSAILGIAITMAAPAPPAESESKPPSGVPSDAAAVTLELTPRPVAYASASAKWANGFKTILGKIAKVDEAIKKAGLTPAGHPFALFLATDDKSFQFEAMVPIAEIPEATEFSDGVKIGKSPAGTAIKFLHRGAYDDIDSTYDLINVFLDEKGLESQNRFVEEYLTDTTEPDDDNLEADIYVFVKPPVPPAAPPSAQNNAPAPAPKSKVGFSSGSGFFVSNEGHVLTSNHVIEDCTKIGVSMDQEEPADARAVARDATNDLALLSTTLKPPTVATLRSGLRLGESVAAFGFPHADVRARSGNFTMGNATALVGIGDDSRYLQVSAPVQAGSSGGPLLDQNGNLVGIVTYKLNARKWEQEYGDLPQNVNFALKAAIIAKFLHSNRINFPTGSARLALKPEELADRAKSMSVFILCK